MMENNNNNARPIVFERVFVFVFCLFKNSNPQVLIACGVNFRGISKQSIVKLFQVD